MIKNKKGVASWIWILLIIIIVGMGIYFLFFSGGEGGSIIPSFGSSIPQPPALPS